MQLESRPGMLFMPGISMDKDGNDNRFTQPFLYRMPKCRATIKLLPDHGSKERFARLMGYFFFAKHWDSTMNLSYKNILAFTAALFTTGPALADMTAMQRAERFGVSDIRGIAYIPGPAGPAKPLDPKFNGVLPYFQGEIQTYDDNGNPYYYSVPGNPQGKLLAKYTIYYDSDFYNADFLQLWGKGTPGGKDEEGRDDLGRYKTELNANFVHLYDWNTDPKLRNHGPFLKYANQLGMNVTIPVSNYTYKILCGYEPGDWQMNVKQIFDEVYEHPAKKPVPAAGVLKIFNEYDGSDCRNADFVAKVALYWKELEDQRGVLDQDRLPIIFPVTFSIQYGIAGGAVLDAFNAITDSTELGLEFWKARVIYATNPFNDGAFMKQWIETELPAWFASNKIPADTPVMFTEYGRSSEESNPPDEAGQADWVKGQFQAMWKPAKPANFLGTCAFVNEYRFWLSPPEPNFALTDFNRGGGVWNKPKTMYAHIEKYRNPNAPIGVLWQARYQVDPQKPRPAYCEVARAYSAQPSAECP